MEPIHIIGGGTKNKLLNQFTANSTGRNVVAGPSEATAAGNILMQAIALGHLGSLEDGRALVRQSFDIETYHPKNQVEWDDAYKHWLSLSISNQF